MKKIFTTQTNKSSEGEIIMKKKSNVSEITRISKAAENKEGEITMTTTRTKKHSFRTRIFAAVIAAVTACSVSAFSMTSVSAVEMSDDFKSAMKTAGIETVDAAFETVADLIPGGKIIIAPFKSVFHTGVDDPDPMEDISKKLDQLDGKLDKLDQKLGDLEKNINKNTQWMGEKIENTADMSELRCDFKGLSPKVAKLVKDVKAAETQPGTNKTQRIMRLAVITDTLRYDDITDYVYNIQKSMDGVDPVYVDMFKALYTRSALDKMFAREAYNEALPLAQELTAQYVYAVVLMQECQTAVKAVAKFSTKDIEALKEGNGTEYEMYRNFNTYRHSMDDNDPVDALVSAAIGIKNFKTRYDRVAFINKSAKTAGKEVTFGQKDGYEYIWAKDNCDYLGAESIAKNNALTTKELSTVADYVRENFNNKSLYEFFTKDLGIKGLKKNSYVLVSDKISVSKTRNESLDKYFNPDYKYAGYNRKGTMKAIELDDNDVKVTALTLFTYVSYDDDFCSFIFGVDEDIKECDGYAYWARVISVCNA